MISRSSFPSTQDNMFAYSFTCQELKGGQQSEVSTPSFLLPFPFSLRPFFIPVFVFVCVWLLLTGLLRPHRGTEEFPG